MFSIPPGTAQDGITRSAFSPIVEDFKQCREPADR
jgi:hypothetical protein